MNAQWVLRENAFCKVVEEYLGFLNAKQVAGHQLEGFRVVRVIMQSFLNCLLTALSCSLLHTVKKTKVAQHQ